MNYVVSRWHEVLCSHAWFNWLWVEHSTEVYPGLRRWRRTWVRLVRNILEYTYALACIVFLVTSLFLGICIFQFKSILEQAYTALHSTGRRWGMKRQIWEWYDPHHIGTQVHTRIRSTLVCFVSIGIAKLTSKRYGGYRRIAETASPFLRLHFGSQVRFTIYSLGWLSFAGE